MGLGMGGGGGDVLHGSSVSEYFDLCAPGSQCVDSSNHLQEISEQE